MMMNYYAIRKKFVCKEEKKDKEKNQNRKKTLLSSLIVFIYDESFDFQLLVEGFVKFEVVNAQERRMKSQSENFPKKKLFLVRNAK